MTRSSKESAGQEAIRCRVNKASDCYDGRRSLDVYFDEGMADDSTFDGETVICDACYILIGEPTVGPGGGDPATLAGGKGRPQ